MSFENDIELVIHVDSDKILFEYTKTNGPGKKYAPDEYNEETIRIELQVAKTFHKVLNYLYLKKDIFQKEDFEILGEMLRKILYGKLGEAVVEGIVFQFLESARGTAKGRMYLEFEKNCELSVLPWEYTILKDEKNRSIYPAANKDKNFDFIRRIDAAGNLRRIATKKLNCVFIISSIKRKIQGEEEIPAVGDDEVQMVTGLFEELKKNYPQQFDFQVLNNPAFEDLDKEIEKAVSKFEHEGNDPALYTVHYLGHSSFDGEGRIAFFRNDNTSHWIKDYEFAQVFDPRNLDFGSPQMFVLQACDSAKLSNYGAGRGVALALVNQRIPAVLGMQNEVDVSTSTEFMKCFYEALLNGSDVGEAVTIGRTYLGKGAQDVEGRYLKGAADWYKTNAFGSPVLFITTLRPVYFFEQTVPVIDDTVEKNVFKKCRLCKVELEVPESQATCKRLIREPGRPSRLCGGILDEIELDQETSASAVSSAVDSKSAIEVPSSANVLKP